MAASLPLRYDLRGQCGDFARKVALDGIHSPHPEHCPQKHQAFIVTLHRSVRGGRLVENCQALERIMR